MTEIDWALIKTSKRCMEWYYFGRVKHENVFELTFQFHFNCNKLFASREKLLTDFESELWSIFWNMWYKVYGFCSSIYLTSHNQRFIGLYFHVSWFFTALRFHLFMFPYIRCECYRLLPNINIDNEVLWYQNTKFISLNHIRTCNMLFSSNGPKNEQHV